MLYYYMKEINVLVPWLTSWSFTCCKSSSLISLTYVHAANPNLPEPANMHEGLDAWSV